MNVILRCSTLLIASEVSHEIVHGTYRGVLSFYYIVMFYEFKKTENSQDYRVDVSHRISPKSDNTHGKSE
jgi:hypothetical protein